MANLRAVGCPERLIHDVLVKDLSALYERRREAVSLPSLKPWAGAEARRAAREVQEQREAELNGKLRELTIMLPGFPRNQEAMGFARERDLPREVGLAAFQIRAVAESQARQAIERYASDATALQTRLE